MEREERGREERGRVERDCGEKEGGGRERGKESAFSCSFRFGSQRLAVQPRLGLNFQ